MSGEKKTREFQDRDAAGRTISRKLLDKVDDSASAFRTVVISDVDKEIMLRTKGGNNEVTVKRAEPEGVVCVKSPLIERAFSYNSSTAPVGYRRWYGEPDPAISSDPKDTEYVFSLDGLLCMETREIQKICFTDGNSEKVDFIFSKKPDNGEVGQAASSLNASSTARFKFIEKPYEVREWYGSEVADIGWAFAGPTIDGDPTPEPADAIKFFIRRVRSMSFTFSDAKKKVKNLLVKWIFANQTSTDRAGPTSAVGCANYKSAREVSFTNREFFAVATDGNMEKLTLQLDADEPPTNPDMAKIRLEFKKPGSFISAIDPDGATGNTRPADVEKAIDLCEFSAFGNPYHGLFWDETGEDSILYKDSSKATQWPFSPVSPYVVGGSRGLSLFHRYYNVTGKNSLMEENKVKTEDAANGEMLCDAFLISGFYPITDDTDYANGWGQMTYKEFLYKDPAGTVWACEAEIVETEIADAIGTTKTDVTIWINRRYGILGTEFAGHVSPENIAIRRNAGTFYFDTPYGHGYYGDYTTSGISVAHDAKTICVFSKHISTGRILERAIVTMSGAGALVASTGVSIGDGISFQYNRSSSPSDYSVGGGVAGVNLFTIITGLQDTRDFTQDTIDCPSTANGSPVPTYYFPYQTLFATPEYSQASAPNMLNRQVLDYVWVDGDGGYSWQEVIFTSRFEMYSRVDTVHSSVNGEFGSPPGEPYCITYPPGGCVNSTVHTPATAVIQRVEGLRVVGKITIAGNVVSTVVLDCTSTTYSGAGSPSDFFTTTGTTSGWESLSSPSMSNAALVVKPFAYEPRALVWNGESWVPQTSGYVPFAWAIVRAGDALVVDAAHYAPTSLVFKNASLEVNHNDLCHWIQPVTGYRYDAKIGWAYDYRSKELVEVPFGVTAYFI